MLKVSKKPTTRRVGMLCLMAFGLTAMSCQQESVAPQARPKTGYATPPSTPTDSLQTNDDQPPKDVDGGKGS